jgi:hypothetical protein
MKIRLSQLILAAALAVAAAACADALTTEPSSPRRECAAGTLMGGSGRCEVPPDTTG